jgi:hypothetical protein
MKKHLFCILIGEPDNAFRKKLRNTFTQVQVSLPAVKFNFIEADNVARMVRELRTKEPDMLFLNADYLSDDPQRILRLLKPRKRKHQLIMLIADEHTRKVKELATRLEGGRTAYLSGHIYKDNFSFDLLAVLIRFFVRRALG